MVPLIEVEAISTTATVEDAVQKMLETGFSRLPVYEERIDHIIGFVSHWDLLVADRLDATASTLLHHVSFVPETMRLEPLLHSLQRKRQRLAVVVDEYGGAVGIITVEDALEEIVGEIEDEFDQEETDIRAIDERRWRVDGRVETDALEEAIGLSLPEGDYETLAGFLLTRFGHIPAVGEQLHWQGWTFTVTRASERAIREVVLMRSRDTPHP